MIEFVWSDRAVKDLQSIKEFWVPRDPFLVVDLDRELNTAIDFLVENPGAGSPVGRSHRRKWKIGKTPFLLFYTLRSNSLQIGRIRHQHQNWLRLH